MCLFVSLSVSTFVCILFIVYCCLFLCLFVPFVPFYQFCQKSHLLYSRFWMSTKVFRCFYYCLILYFSRIFQRLALTFWTIGNSVALENLFTFLKRLHEDKTSTIFKLRSLLVVPKEKDVLSIISCQKVDFWSANFCTNQAHSSFVSQNTVFMEKKGKSPSPKQEHYHSCLACFKNE